MQDVIGRILALLPSELAAEIRRLGRSYRAFGTRLSEIRLRAGGCSALVLGGRHLPLRTTVSERELEELTVRLSGGGLYAVRDTLARGFLPFEGGVRVGVAGRARYDGESLVGIDRVRTLVFRLPTGACELTEELLALVGAGIGHGLLLYSPPGGGKTTALRALATQLGRGPCARRICLVDERDEFDDELFLGTTVDVLRGYRRPLAVEIATRTLSPELLMIDELGDEAEARALLGVLGCGVPVIATAHAACGEELLRRGVVRTLVDGGVFDVVAGLITEGGRRRMCAERIA